MSEVVTKGSFKFYNGHVFYGYNLLLQKVSDIKVKLNTSVRSKITSSDLSDFDNLIFDIKTKGYVDIEYIDSLANENDGGKQFEGFLNSKNLEGNKAKNVAEGLGLSDEEIIFAIAFEEQKKTYEDIKARVEKKFKDHYKLPTLPYAKSTAVDIDACYGNKANDARIWMNDTSVKDTLHTNNSWECANLLRVRKVNDTRSKIESMSGMSISVKLAEPIIKYALSKWKNPNYSPSAYDYKRFSTARYDSHDVKVAKDYIKVGCQNCPRSEVERIATELGWLD